MPTAGNRCRLIATNMRAWVTALVILAVGVFASAAGVDNGADLAAQAQASPLDKQPELYIKAAKAHLKAADDLYNAGKVDEARAEIDAVVADSDRAADTATRSRRRLKNTEIDLRKMAEHLRDMKRTLNLDDQPPVQAAMDHLENLRTGLLNLMFGKRK
jgi:hypothetical protein